MARTRRSPVVTVTGYLRVLQARLTARTTESAEAQLADLLPELLRSLAEDAGRPGIDLLGQAYEAEVGWPDFSVKDGALLIGHVETKAPGTGADVAAFRRPHDRHQWERFRNLPNLLYTDGTSFGLYRSGERDGDVLTLSFDPEDERQEADPGETAQLVCDGPLLEAVAPGLA